MLKGCWAGAKDLGGENMLSGYRKVPFQDPPLGSLLPRVALMAHFSVCGDLLSQAQNLKHCFSSITFEAP